MIGYRNGKLHVEEVPVERIVRRVGTPVYVYSKRAILEQVESFRAAFATQRNLICYAVKANTNGAICRLLAAAGVGADVVSGGELRRALAAGFPPDRIVFSGVGKTPEELDLALGAGVMTFNVESSEELDALERVARRRRRIAPTAIRVNPGVDPDTHEHISTGRNSHKFGVEPREARRLFRRAHASRWLLPIGIHGHIGSQIAAVAPYRKALGVLLGLVDRLAREGIPLGHVDVGGGMGIRYEREKPLDPRRLAASLLPALKNRPALRLVLEPGRFLVADAGLLATKVLYRKRSSRKRFIVVDAAMNDLIRSALYDAYHEIVPFVRTRRRRVKVDVVGPVCETADFLARDRRLPWPERGELWAVLQAGAYGFAMSSHYNSRPRPAEVLVSKNRFRVVRVRETLIDIMRHERSA